MSKRLIVLDLDGTIITFSGKISKKDCSAIFAAANNGHIIAVVTGRTEQQLPKAISAASHIRYIATASGARIFDRKEGTRVEMHTLPLVTAKQIACEAEKQNLGIHVSYQNHQIANYRAFKMILDALIEIDGGKLSTRTMWIAFNTFRNVRPVMNTAKAMIPTAGTIDKIEIFGLRNKKREWLKWLNENFGVSAVDVGYSLEITAGMANKGAAVDIICRSAGIPSSHVIAFGDSGNDVSMRQSVGTLVAMGNACDELKSIADEVAPSVEFSGVSSILKRLEIGL